MITTSLVEGEINFYSNQLIIKLYQKFVDTVEQSFARKYMEEYLEELLTFGMKKKKENLKN